MLLFRLAGSIIVGVGKTRFFRPTEKKGRRIMKYKTELHCHTSLASGCSDESERDTVEKYIEHGYTTLVLTNHFHEGEIDSCGGDYYDAVDRFYEAYRLAQEAAAGRINVLCGMEIRFTECDNDYLVFGMTEEYVRAHENIHDTDVCDAHEMFRRDGILLIQAHPMRNRIRIVNPAYLDGIEVFNGHNAVFSRNEMAEAWYEYNKRFYPDLIKTSGTDHHDDWHRPSAGILTDEPVRTMDQLVATLRSGNYELIKRPDIAKKHPDE